MFKKDLLENESDGVVGSINRIRPFSIFRVCETCVGAREIDLTLRS